MPEQHKPYPPLPAETARAVRNTFHIENLYLLLGDQLPSLLVKVDMAGIGAASGSSPDHFVLLSLVTIFQYVENLPDEKAIELLRTRLDWKYAMHLPLNYPGMEGIQLCDFRRQLLSGRNSHESFQQILEGIKETSLMGARDRQTVKSVQLVNAVCRLSR